MNAADQIIKYLLEYEAGYDAAENYYERVGRNRIEIMQEFLALSPEAQARGTQVSWNKVPAARLKRIWLDFGKSKVIRDEKGLDNIADRMLENIARIKAVTELVGHETYDVKEELAQEGIVLTPEQWLDFWNGDFITNQFSDYAMKPLEILYSKLFDAESAEDKLYIIDRILNVIHQRGDLAALFIEGGSATLREIFDQGGYSPEYQGLVREDLGGEEDYSFSELASEPYKSPFLEGYIEALFFTEDEQLKEDLEKWHEKGKLLDIEEPLMSQSLRYETEQDCFKFEHDNSEDIATGDSAQAGRDFWFTRNGHGVGFWDGDWPEPQDDRLTAASKAFGEIWVYLGDDGLVYGSH